ncbi:hypothetical protein [Sphaerotilus mobilis]|uniref:Uncharacterized protein n=1 Tax=Sphaerotilus mobilis TaxID=47994 RepID=A0A4Q7LSM3_9BURK|nr:hypothetical protein [Sphaerotilus mobilis]RZS57806.1 hypothetical protein EV685_0076 [Sphaerotilus mobilis]
MSRPSTTREALIAEAIGDLGQLLQQVEQTQAALRASDLALKESAATLVQQSTKFQAAVAQGSSRAKVELGLHIAKQATRTLEEMVSVQTQAMNETTRTCFAQQIEPQIQRLVQPLNRLHDRLERPWERWMLHAATALCSSTMTWAVTVYLLRR